MKEIKAISWFLGVSVEKAVAESKGFTDTTK